MKFKLLHCLLAASSAFFAYFSTQAVIVVNDTSSTIRLDNFTKASSSDYSDYVNNRNFVAITIQPGCSINTHQFNVSITALSVTVNDQTDSVDQLSDITVLKFVENQEGTIYYIRS